MTGALGAADYLVELLVEDVVCTPGRRRSSSSSFGLVVDAVDQHLELLGPGDLGGGGAGDVEMQDLVLGAGDMLHGYRACHVATGRDLLRTLLTVTPRMLGVVLT